ncbi:hypothetical protein GGR58DRAFT_321297 [Xylaria digitata]|nr:hypothetical protein GGR58DRAFT_321297 [Xylaria digitata]
MASTYPSGSRSALLAIPLELRRHIYSYCIPQHLTFDCAEDMYYQNRPLGWIQPLWHSNDGCDGFAEDDDYFVGELHCLQDEWKGKDRLSPLEHIEDIGSEDSSTEGNGSGYGMKKTVGLLRPEGRYYPSPSSRMSSLPALLLLCRQINDEVETMLYEGNTFTVDIDCQGQYHLEKQFTKKNRERMRHIILVLQPIRPQPSLLMDPEIWDSVLGNLVTLGVIVKQTERQEWFEDNEKEAPGNFLDFFAERKREAVGELMTWLLPVFEYLVRAVPKQTEIVVDVTEEEDTVRALEFFQEGPFRFQRLPAADSIPNKIEFAWESESRGPWYQDDDDCPASCRDIGNDSDYDYSD